MTGLCVDLTNLRQITDDDRDLEVELFTEFIQSSTRIVSMLEQSQGDDSQDIWSKSAHALKGISFNLGAAQLGLLCQEAQEKASADASQKAVMLNNIQREHANVIAFLNAQLA